MPATRRHGIRNQSLCIAFRRSCYGVAGGLYSSPNSDTGRRCRQKCTLQSLYVRGPLAALEWPRIEDDVLEFHKEKRDVASFFCDRGGGMADVGRRGGRARGES